jgi:hypothetical protein
MKKYLISIIVFSSLFFIGCDDFLTVESPDFSTEKFWRNAKDVESGLSAAYGQLDNRSGSYTFPEVKYVVEAFREDIMIKGADVNNYPEWVQIYDFTYNNGSGRFKNYWMNCYNGINYTNNVLNGIEKVQTSGEKMDTELYNTLKGEALFIRAYNHFKLLINWEKIIIRDEYLTSEAQTHKALSTRIEAWDFICKEFDKASKLLPKKRTEEELGRATQGAALAYLGWSYLTRAYEENQQKNEFLTQALNAFNGIEGYQLEKNFTGMFNGTVRNSKESIFELQFTESTADGTWHKHVLHYWVAAPVLRGWDEIRPSEMIVNEFKKEGRIATTGQLDSRAYGTLFFADPYYETGSKIYGFNYSDLFDENDEINRCFRKFMPPTDDVQNLRKSFVGYNIPVMRYANVLLMKAEVLNEQGHPDQAIPLINQIRDIHGDMPPMQGTTYEAVKAQIEHERLLEFPLENVRFYDLRRWGKLDEALHKAGRTNFNATKHAFLPIPLMEIQTNNEIN